MSRVKGIDPGRLNHRVTIKRYAEKEDDLGNTVNELVPVKTVWAEILPIKGQEGLEYYKNNNTETYKIRLRAKAVSDRTEKDVICWKERQFLIQTIADLRMDGVYYEIQCIEDKDHSVPEGTEGDGEDHGGD